MAIKHLPIRTCIATGIKLPKNKLIRLVRLENNTVKVDIKGKEKGRGANISMDINAFDLAIKKNLITRALKLNRKLKEEEISILKEEFINAIEYKKFRKGNKSVTIKVSKEELEKLD